MYQSSLTESNALFSYVFNFNEIQLFTVWTNANLNEKYDQVETK